MNVSSRQSVQQGDIVSAKASEKKANGLAIVRQV